MHGAVISLVIMVALGMAAWYVRDSKSVVIRRGILIAFLISCLALLSFLPSGNPLFVNKENPGHLPSSKPKPQMY